MTPLGKPLVFHLKYLAEMYLLNSDPEAGEEVSDLEGLDDSVERVRKMARIVGAAADEQAADFIELCGKEIEDHFTNSEIAKLVRKTKRAYAFRNWEWDARFQIPAMKNSWFSCGVFVTAPPDLSISLEKDVCGLVIPYLWSKGGRKGADALWKVVGGWAHSRAGQGLVIYSGTVALACIPIKPQPPESFDVDRDQLIIEVKKTFARIDAEQTKAIASFVAGLKEPDES